jgi:5S rRNA maturation endonuclease (ribonuclease M5)
MQLFQFLYVAFIPQKSAYEPFFMTILEKLKDVKNINEFALLLGFQPKMLSYILYIMPNVEKCYETFTIPKKNGNLRIINSPNKKLKLLQRRLANLLYECYDEIFGNKKGTRILSHGFRRGYSIFTNSVNHCKKRYVFNIDLKDFFPSINFGRVRGYFINDKNFKLNEKVATIIAQIACFENQLPQGSPVSPIISNFIGNILDVKLLKLSKEVKCFYSRYADDLTFSTNNKQFPYSIAFENNTHWVIGEKLRTLIENSGFNINETKLSMQYKYSRQTCVGLVINKKVNVKREYYRKIRAMCSNLFKYNTFYINKNDENYSIAQLEGMLNFVYWIKKHYYRLKTQNKDYKQNAIIKLYGKFLFYKYFINIDKPIIFTEGKSDVVYLKCALKNMKDSYSNLIDVIDGKYNFKINFFKTTNVFKDVFSFSEGVSGLENMMRYYKKEIDNFNTLNYNMPIIIIIDNDEGAKNIKKLLEISHEMPYYKLFYKRMYVLFVEKKEHTAIENLFDEDLLNTEIDGKIFKSDKKNGENDNYYSKHIFSQKVILPNYEKINFDRFKPIFNNMLEIISECKK